MDQARLDAGRKTIPLPSFFLRVRPSLARPGLALIFFLVALAGAGWVSQPVQDRQPSAVDLSWWSPTHPRAAKVVFLAGGLSDEHLVEFTAALTASGHPGALLIDSAPSRPYIASFLSAFQPEKVLPVGSFAGPPSWDQRGKSTLAPSLPWKPGLPLALWKRLFPRAERVVVSPGQPWSLLLRAACLAGTLRAPLYVLRKEAAEPQELPVLLKEWQTREVLALGASIPQCRDLPGVRVTPLETEAAVAACCLEHRLSQGRVDCLVVANPADRDQKRERMSVLAPLVVGQKRALLLLTDAKGNNVADLVRKVDRPGMDNLLLLGGFQALPQDSRPNPAPGRDTEILMEPLTPQGAEPFSYAVGRLFHPDLAVTALMLARQRLLVPTRGETVPSGSRRALVASNPGGGLPLMETFSRNTAKELHNRGYQTTALFENEVVRDKIEQLVPQQDIFLWEGHYKTLMEEFELPKWDQPLRPALVFLQSCLALNEKEAHPLLERGAVSVVGSGSRTYSGTGGAFALAFFDAMLYDQQPLGGSLRQAKNFLLAWSLFKEKSLGQNAQLKGANLRAAWAFSLWGDPTLKLPVPAPPANALPPVQCHRRGNSLVLALPATPHAEVKTEKFQAQLLPNARLAGLVQEKTAGERRRLVPLLFAEVSFPEAPPGKLPRLTSRLPESHWVFCWDRRRRVGYLLAKPRARDTEEIRFSVKWDG